MLTCPICDTELNEVALGSGRCPACGGLLWDEGPEEPLAATPFEASQSAVERGPLLTVDWTALSGTPPGVHPVAAGRPPQAPASQPRPGVSGIKESTLSLKQILLKIVERGSGAPPRDRPGEVVSPPSSLPAGPAGPAGPAPAPPMAIVTDSDLPLPVASGPPGAAAPRQLSGEDLDQMSQMWRRSISPRATPGMTLKGASGGTTVATSLVVQRRTVAAPRETKTGPADYELLGVIGEGGVGVVYSARQGSIDRTVALKMLKPEIKDDDDHRMKFLSEAVVTGDLEHPNIVPIYDLGTNEAGALFYAMKRVHGTPWSAVLHSKAVADNLTLLLSVADAIAFAHARGIIHRDLKPENVMLGDFGEVLVMDWGIALSTPLFLKSGSITQSTGMGGTPAYMAPEMATGPMEVIGPASDVYLLGAILFEIVTGNPPHHGQDVMSCVHAAARNEIRPTDRTGELLDIAYQALATRPEDRYSSVQEFQAAIRQYQSHTESIALSARAEENLAKARQTRDYQDFSRALFAFQEAHDLWAGNGRAQVGVGETQAAYSQCALEKGDFDLGLSLLKEDNPAHRDLRKRLRAAQDERETRQQHLRKLKRLAFLLALTAFTILTVALLGVGTLWRQADLAKEQAEELAQSEKKAKGEAQKSAEREKDAKDEAVDAATRETQAKEAAEGAAQRAQDAEKVAVDARLAAEAASYVAQVGLAAGQIASNSFLDAERVLREYQQPGKTSLRDWEWGHLTYLCNLAYRTLKASQRVECVAWSPDGRYLVAGSIDGWVRVWAFPACEELVRIDHHTPVHAVAITPDGQFLATGGDGPQGPDEPAEIKLWKLSGDGRQATFERALAGHGRAVLALHFSPDQAWLLSSSRDETARLWSWRSAQQEVAFRGHFGPVWSAAFAPAGDRLVTAGEDATVRVWTRADGTELKRFRGHKGAVYAAAFSPDGRRVASAGRDNRILVWEPDRIQDFDFAALERQLANQGSETVSAPDTEPDRPLPVQVLAGHNAEIRTLEFASHFRGQEGDFLLSGGHDHTVRVWNLQAAAATTDRGRTFRGHGGWVRAAVFSPDGRYILSGGYDSQLKLWDPTQYEEVRVLRGQDSPIGSVAFSRRADRAITAGRDGVAVIWHLEQAQPLKRLEETLDDDVGRRDEKVSPGESAARLKEGHDFLVNTGVFFPEGDHRLLTSAGDNTVRMWDLTTGGQLRCFRPTGQTNALALSDDGKWILTGSDGSAAQLWPTDDAEAAPLPLADHRHEITAVAISPGGELPSRRLLTGDANGECRLWRWDSQQNRWSTYAQLIGHAPGHSITAMRFLPGNRELLTACQDRTVMRWEVATGRPLPALMLKHPDGVRLMEVSADGRQAVTVCLGSAGYRLSHWDLEHAREEQTRVIAEGTVTSVAFDQAGRGVLVCVSATTGTSSVQRWDPTDGQYGPLWPEPGSRGTIWAAVPSPDGSQVLTVGGRRARLWEARTGQLRQIFGHHGPLTSASFSPSGALAVTAGTDGAVKLWNVSEQDPGFGRVKLKIPQAHDGLAVNTAMFVADASGADAWLLTGGDDGVARLWDLSGHERQSFVPPGTPRDALAPVCCAVCSPDGQRLATAHQDGTLRIWDVAGKLATLVGEPRAHDLAVLSVCFSQDGRRLVTGSGDNTVKLWNLETNRAICTLKGHTASVTSVAFFPDGRRVVSGSQDGMAKIWDTASGNQVLNLGRHAAEVTAVAVSSDGRRVLTASNDQTAILWFSDDFTEPAAEKKP